MDVHAGGFTAEFGDRMSSVIEATSIHPEADQHYELGLSLFNASLVAFNRFAEGAGQWLVAARRSNLDEIADLVDALLRRDQLLGRLRPARLRLLAGHARQPARAAVDRQGERDELARTRRPSAADYRNTYAWATLEHDFSPQLHASAIASYTYVSTERTGEVDEDGIREGAVGRRATLRRGSACSSPRATRPSAG